MALVVRLVVETNEKTRYRFGAGWYSQGQPKGRQPRQTAARPRDKSRGRHQPLYPHRPESGRLSWNSLFLFVGAEGRDQKTLGGAEGGGTQKNIFVQAPQRRAWNCPLSPASSPSHRSELPL